MHRAATCLSGGSRRGERGCRQPVSGGIILPHESRQRGAYRDSDRYRRGTRRQLARDGASPTVLVRRLHWGLRPAAARAGGRRSLTGLRQRIRARIRRRERATNCEPEQNHERNVAQFVAEPSHRFGFNLPLPTDKICVRNTSRKHRSLLNAEGRRIFSVYNFADRICPLGLRDFDDAHLLSTLRPPPTGRSSKFEPGRQRIPSYDHSGVVQKLRQSVRAGRISPLRRLRRNLTRSPDAGSARIFILQDRSLFREIG